MGSHNTSKSVLINSLVSRDINEEHRGATSLELFYDLIYVVAIASLAAEFHHALSAWHHIGHVIAIAYFVNNVLFISIAFVSLNILRLTRAHHQK